MNNITSTRTTTEKKAYLVFLIVGTIYDLMPSNVEWISSDESDKEAASQIRAALIELNDLEYGHKIFSAIHSLCGELFEVLEGEYNPSNTKHKLEKVLISLVEEFPWLPKGNSMNEEELRNEIIKLSSELNLELK
jgi:hypothetical protein